MLINGYAQNISQRRTSNTCRNHEDCPTYAYCEHVSSSTDNGLCVCQEGYMIVAENKTRKCYKVASHINEPCIFDDQCKFKLSTEAECRNHICQCQAGSHFVKRENECYKSAGVGEYCRLTNNCLGEHTVCRSGVCQCPMDTHLDEISGECVPDVYLGEVCSSHVECITLYSRCHDVCRCTVSHIISVDGTRCLKIADSITNPCEEDNQCQVHIAHSICGENNTCVCRDGYHVNNYKCYVSVLFGGICENDENCINTPGAVCNTGRCECMHGFRLVDGQCSLGSTLLSSSSSVTIQVLLLFILKLLCF